MRTGRALLAAVLLWVVQAVGVCGASVPVFQHDPVSEQAYYHEHILPRLIPLAVIVCIVVPVVVVAVRKARRKANQAAFSDAGERHD